MSENVRVLCTREVASSIDASSKQLITDTIERYQLSGFRVTDSEITHETGSKIIFMGLLGNSKAATRTRIKSLEGVNIAWVEEAQSCTMEIIQLIDPTIRGDKNKIIYSMNPYAMPDAVIEFYSKREDVETIIMNLSDNPFAPIDQVESSKALQKSDPILWDHIYGGNPLSIGDRAIISLKDYEEATKRPFDGSQKEVIGADIARFGDDTTVFVKRRGNAIIDIKKLVHSDLMNSADELIRFGRGIPCRVDDTGLGGGVTDYLRRKGYPCQPVNFAESAMDKSKYTDIVSEMWFTFADKIKTASIPLDTEIRYQLTTRQYTYDSYGRRKVESKADYKKRAGKSPDIADAILLAYYDIDRKPIHFYR